MVRDVYYTKEQLDHATPSRRDGIDLQQETKTRRKYCELLAYAARKLGLCAPPAPQRGRSSFGFLSWVPALAIHRRCGVLFHSCADPTWASVSFLLPSSPEASSPWPPPWSAATASTRRTALRTPTTRSTCAGTPTRKHFPALNPTVPTNPNTLGPPLPQTIAAAALYLATKVEESPRALEDLVQVFFRARNGGALTAEQLDEQLKDPARARTAARTPARTDTRTHGYGHPLYLRVRPAAFFSGRWGGSRPGLTVSESPRRVGVCFPSFLPQAVMMAEASSICRAERRLLFTIDFEARGAARPRLKSLPSLFRLPRPRASQPL